MELVVFYFENVWFFCEGFSVVGFEVYGGVNVFYVWFKMLDSLSSWDFFDKLFGDVYIVGILGSGFGVVGEGYFCLSVFNFCENIFEVVCCI